MTDILITWPQSKPLEDYLAELERAEAEGKLINFRVSHLPLDLDIGERCFVTYRGWCRGFNIVVGMGYLEEGEVEDWPAGNYIIRSPEWHPLPKPRRAKGRRGFVYLAPRNIERYLGLSPGSLEPGHPDDYEDVFPWDR